MHIVYCPRCDRGLGECKLLPGTLNRYRCKRCGDWTSLVAVGVDATEHHDNGSNGHADHPSPDAEDMHMVFCVSCGRGMGESRLLPGALNRYHCKACKEWMWFVGVPINGKVGKDGSNGS